MTEIIKKIEDYNVIEYEKSNIYIIENIIDDVFCDTIIHLIETLPLIKVAHKYRQNVECYIAYTTELLKENDEIFYIFPSNTSHTKSMYSNYLNGITNDELQEQINKISEKMKIVSTIIKQINNGISLNHNSGYNLRKIYGRTKIHSDGLINIHDSDITFINKEEETEEYKMVRNASIIFALNDNYEGGIFHFPVQDISFKLKRGSVVIFPPYWTHPHEVSSVENGTFRYTINTWSCENIE